MTISLKSICEKLADCVVINNSMMEEDKSPFAMSMKDKTFWYEFRENKCNTIGDIGESEKGEGGFTMLHEDSLDNILNDFEFNVDDDLKYVLVSGLMEEIKKMTLFELFFHAGRIDIKK